MSQILIKLLLIVIIIIAGQWFNCWNSVCFSRHLPHHSCTTESTWSWFAPVPLDRLELIKRGSAWPGTQSILVVVVDDDYPTTLVGSGWGWLERVGGVGGGFECKGRPVLLSVQNVIRDKYWQTISINAHVVLCSTRGWENSRGSEFESNRGWHDWLSSFCAQHVPLTARQWPRWTELYIPCNRTGNQDNHKNKTRPSVASEWLESQSEAQEEWMSGIRL